MAKSIQIKSIGYDHSSIKPLPRDSDTHSSPSRGDRTAREEPSLPHYDELYWLVAHDQEAFSTLRGESSATTKLATVSEYQVSSLGL